MNDHIKAAKVSLIGVQQRIGQMLVMDCPKDVPIEFFERVQDMLAQLRSFCSLQMALLDELEKLQ